MQLSRSIIVVVTLVVSATSCHAQSEPQIEPDRIAFKPNGPLSVRALVTTPPFVKGLLSWSIETKLHRGYYSVTAQSPDGKLLATGGLDGTIRLWEIATGKLVRALIGHDSYVYGLAFSPGGRYLASGGSFDATARIWDVNTGQPLKVLKGHPTYVTLVAWTPDGKKLIGVGGTSGEVSVWEISSGQKRAKASLGQHIMSLSAHPDSLRAAAVTTESPLLILDLTTGKTMRSMGEAANKYQSLSWSPNGKQLAAASTKGTFLHDAATGDVAAKLEGASHLVAWSADGSRLATASSADATIKVWNTTDNALLHKAPASATTMHLQPGNAQVVVGDTLGVSLVNLADGKLVARYEIAGTVPPMWTSGRPIFTGMGTAALSLWDSATGMRLHKLDGHTSSVMAFAWSPDGKALTTAAYDKTVRVWDAADGTERFNLKDHTAPVTCVAWSPDGKGIASGGHDKKVLIWDAKSGALTQTLADHRLEITCLAWSASSNTLAVGVKDGNVFLYPRATWKQGKPLATAQLTSPSSLAWSPDGKTLATGDSNGIVILWSVPNGKLLTEFPTSGSPPYISSMLFYPKGDVLACGRGNHTMDIWSLKNGQKLHTPPTMAPVQQVVWSGTGPMLAVAAADRTCRFFDPFTGKLRGVLLADADQMVSVTADGHFRAEGPALDRLVFVAQSEKSQDTLTAAEFAAKYKWKNNANHLKFAGK